MGMIDDFLQGIPLNAVLRERLALAEQKYKDMETENKELKQRVASLTTEVATLAEKIAKAPVASEQPKEKPEVINGVYYFDGDKSTPYCPRCYANEGKKHAMSRIEDVGKKCPICGCTVLL